MKVEQLLPLQEQAAITNSWLKERFSQVLGDLMARENIDMWLVTAREYNEDPVIMSLLPAPSIHCGTARGRTLLVFTLKSDATVERSIIARSSLDGFYDPYWNEDLSDQGPTLLKLVEERDPQRIGINTSSMCQLADGLTHSQYQWLEEALGPYAQRMVSAEKLAIGWLEKRSGSEQVAYEGIVRHAHRIIATAFSPDVVHTGITTANQVAWWIRQAIHDVGARAWFHPTVDIQRQGEEKVSGDAVILPGDVLHCDVGLEYLGLCTDTQQHAYVLRPGENQVPSGLKEALKTGNRLQDIHAGAYATGRSGNEILSLARKQAEAEGIKGSIYTHPIGYHGHGAGPIIGLWDKQDAVPGVGELVVHDDTCFSMELNIEQAIPEWDSQVVRIMLEQDVLYHDEKISFMDGRQTEWLIIG